MKLIRESERIHISHMYYNVSAWERSAERLQQLEDDMKAALLEAQTTGKMQYVDQDGEMFFEVSPSGCVALCARYRTYTSVEL